MFQMTYNPYSGLPTWLDEGLAMYGEGTLNMIISNVWIGSARGTSLQYAALPVLFGTLGRILPVLRRELQYRRFPD